jgi:hypothetical protein
MAARDERETQVNHDISGGKLYVYSTQKGIWNRCERLGMTLELKDGGGRGYVGPDSLFGFTVRRKRPGRPATGRPFQRVGGAKSAG